MGLLPPHRVFPAANAGVGKQTYKMGEGKAAQDMVEQLEMRRTLREYGLEGAVRKFGVWLENDDLGLTGKLDLLLEMATEAAIVEFKLTSGRSDGTTGSSSGAIPCW